jgi:hypothetical protein
MCDWVDRSIGRGWGIRICPSALFMVQRTAGEEKLTLGCKSSILLWIPVQILLFRSLEYFISRILIVSIPLKYFQSRVGRTYLGISPDLEPAVT